MGPCPTLIRPPKQMQEPFATVTRQFTGQSTNSSSVSITGQCFSMMTENREFLLKTNSTEIFNQLSVDFAIKVP